MSFFPSLSPYSSFFFFLAFVQMIKFPLTLEIDQLYKLVSRALIWDVEQLSVLTSNLADHQTEGGCIALHSGVPMSVFRVDVMFFSLLKCHSRSKEFILKKLKLRCQTQYVSFHFGAWVGRRLFRLV